MKYTYPVIFEPAEEGGFIVSVPDISGCFTEGDSMAEAMEMAKDALETMLVHYEDNKKDIPLASDIKSIKTDLLFLMYLQIRTSGEDNLTIGLLRKIVQFLHGLTTKQKRQVLIFHKFCKMHLKRFLVCLNHHQLLLFEY